MAVSLIQRSFAGGEIAPALYGRADLERYGQGLKTCRNFVVARHGGAFNRPGSEFITAVKTSAERVNLIRFVFSAAQTYVLEFGDQYMRVIRLGARVVVSGVAAWITTTAYEVADLVAEGGTNYYCTTAHTSGTFATDLAAGNWSALTGDIYEIPTPYLEADLQGLRFKQSGDVITIVHRDYAPRQLARTGHTSWTLSVVAFAPTVPAPTSPANSGAAGTTTSWVITSVADETFEESLPTAATESSATPSAGSPITVSWTEEPSARSYNIYKASNGVHGWIGRAEGASFVDTGLEPDTADTPPIDRNPFDASGKWPGVVGFAQQRLVLANSDDEPETVHASRSGNYHNFTIRSPLQDDDAIRFTPAGGEVNEIRAVLEIGKFIILSSGGEWTADGDADGVLKPQAINLRKHGDIGCADIEPVVIGDTAVFVQARGSQLYDLRYLMESDGYTGRDLTVYASHLVDSYTITQLAYQRSPHSVLWAVRSDGVLLGLTYVREQQVWAWHQHELSGTVENVTVVPEDTEDAVYLVVQRTIDGATKRSIERLHARRFDDLRDAFFIDAGLSYDGRNDDGGHTMTLTTAGGWTVDDNLTLTSSAAYFVADDVDNAIHLTIGEETIRCTIRAFTGTTEVTVRPHIDVPVAFQGVATASWADAVDELSGLDHLEGEAVSILADGYVHAQRTVAAGAITLERPFAVIHAGLPITADLEPLDVEVLSDETLVDKRKTTKQVSLMVESSRGGWAGPDEDHLKEFKLEESASETVPDAITGTIEVAIPATWRGTDALLIRQTDPLPLTVLSLVRLVEIGG